MAYDVRTTAGSSPKTKKGRNKTVESHTPRIHELIIIISSVKRLALFACCGVWAGWLFGLPFLCCFLHKSFLPGRFVVVERFEFVFRHSTLPEKLSDRRKAVEI